MERGGKRKEKGTKLYPSLEEQSSIRFVGAIKIEPLTKKRSNLSNLGEGFCGKIESFFQFSTMTRNLMSLDKWRDYFTTANSDIFSVIEHAIMVAASDFPFDFKLKRDRIAEMLFTCTLTAKCIGCNNAELCVAFDDCVKEIVVDGKDSKGSKVSSNSRSGVEVGDDDHTGVMEVNADNQARDQEYADVEALTAEIEEETQFLEEVARIKEVIDEREGKVVCLLLLCCCSLFD